MMTNGQVKYSLYLADIYEEVYLYTRLKTDDDIQGTFYQPELQKVDVQNEDLWKVEEILKTRGKGRKKQYYVKWLHWPKKFNSWLNASDVKNL